MNFPNYDFLDLEDCGNAVPKSNDGEFEDVEVNGRENKAESLTSEFDEFEDAEDDYVENEVESLISKSDEFEDAEDDYVGNEVESLTFESDEFEDMGDDYAENYSDEYSMDFSVEQDTEDDSLTDFFSENSRKEMDFTITTSDRKETTSKKLSMQYLERIFLKEIPVRKVQGRLFYYDGRSYRKADKESLEPLLRSKLPVEVVENISGMSKYREVVDYIKINPALELDARTFPYREEKNYISFRNKVVDAKTLKTYKHKPKFPLFFSINANYQKKTEDTPVFDGFMDAVSGGDKKIKNLILEMLGYLFLHSNDAKKFFVLAMAPDSGKSVLIKFINLLFEEECLMHVPLQNIGDKFTLSDLPYKAVNTHADLSSERVNENSVGVVKNLTGDFAVSYDKKFEDPANTIHHIHLVFCTNTAINLKKQDEAFWNRMVIVPFNYSIPKEEQNDNLVGELYEERDGIVSKAVRAISGVINQNYKFTIPNESRRMWLEWAKNTDDAFQIVMDGLINITGEEEDRLSAKDLYDYYLAECTKNGYYQMSYSEFQNHMKAVYGLEKRKLRLDGKNNPVSVFKGVRMLQ